MAPLSFFGGDRSCGGTGKGLAPVARSARDAAIRGPLAASEERGMVGRNENLRTASRASAPRARSRREAPGILATDRAGSEAGARNITFAYFRNGKVIKPLKPHPP